MASQHQELDRLNRRAEHEASASERSSSSPAKPPAEGASCVPETTGLIELLQLLRELSVKIEVHDGGLRVDAPSGALTDDLQQAIRRHKDGIISLLVGGEERGPVLQPRPVDAGEAAPLSHAQELLWLFQELFPDSTVYNLTTKVRLDGRLDVARLESAAEKLTRRHESLRTVFERCRDGLRQVPREASPVRIPCEDAAGLSAEEQDATLRSILEREQMSPFDLGKDLPFRLVLLRRGPEVHELVGTFHHIAVDGTSIQFFYRDLMRLYAGEPLPDLAVTYRDYAAWERASWEGDARDAEVGYWHEHLADAPGALDFPADFPRQAEPSFACGMVAHTMGREGAEGIDRLSRAENASRFVVMMAAYAATLQRHTNQRDLVIVTPVTGRNRPELRDHVGMFVNQLPLRVRVAPETTFRDLIGNVRDIVREGMKYQEVPYGLILAGLDRTHDAGRTQAFQTMLNVLPADTQEVFDSAEVKCTAPSAMELASLFERVSDFDLTLYGRQLDDELHVELLYNRSLFASAAAERFLEHYVAVLDQAMSEPASRVADLCAIPTAQRRLLLEEWNDTATEYPAGVGLPQAVQQQAEQTADRVAVRSAAGELTYGQLAERARRIAAGLAERGVRPGDRVGVLMHRSHDMVAGLLGIMGAGATYVPLDPNYPDARVRYMVEDSGMTAVLTREGAAERFGLGEIALDLDDWVLPEAGDFVAFDPERAAYVIYTSGSTGKPKGVEVAHRAVLNFLHAMRAQPGLSETDRVLAITTISFDIAVLELYLPLLTGARVYVASEQEVTDGRQLADRIESEGITLLQATPATWRLLLSGGWTGDGELRALVGGETLSRELADRLIPGVKELWNMYGPTETTVWSTVERIFADGPVLIGRPIANTSVYVLDESGEAVPIGVPGELWIGGDGVANGYVNREALTAERFAPSPFREGERIYRTGDLVRHRHDGKLEHLGRLDDQVKVRGFRIELGEVETVLARHPMLAQVAVVVREAESGAQLVAYVVYEEGADLTATEVRDLAAEHLPAYMVPSLVVALDELPLTPNGKVDRNAFPDPFQRAAMAVGQYLPPETEAEKLIAEIWNELLPVERIGTNDQFFTLGGHSLLAMQAVGRIEEATGRRIDPRRMFFQNLRQIAQSLDESPCHEPSRRG